MRPTHNVHELPCGRKAAPVSPESGRRGGAPISVGRSHPKRVRQRTPHVEIPGKLAHFMTPETYQQKMTELGVDRGALADGRIIESHPCYSLNKAVERHSQSKRVERLRGKAKRQPEVATP